MCNNAVQLLYYKLRNAIRKKASQADIEAILQQIEQLEQEKKGEFRNYYHANAFEHPKLRAFVAENDRLQLQRFHWGLIPHWVKDDRAAKTIMNKTVNARGESMFEKAAFRDAALQSRCIVPLDAYFEHQHKRGKTYPHLIRRTDGERMLVGGLTSIYTVPETGVRVPTFAIVTTQSTDELAQVHNNPANAEARMPLILNDNDLATWLYGNQNDVERLIRPNTELEFSYHTVVRLSGEGYPGNVPQVLETYRYAELTDQGELFGE